MEEGDVVLAAAPQADGAVKNRPVILRELPPFNDRLVCGVSRQLGHEVKGFDALILPSDSDFNSCGLVSSSLVRLGFLAVVPLNRIVGMIGEVSPERLRSLRTRLSIFLAP